MRSGRAQDLHGLGPPPADAGEVVFALFLNLFILVLLAAALPFSAAIHLPRHFHVVYSAADPLDSMGGKEGMAAA